MPKVTLTDITSGYDSASAYNANNDRIEAGFDNTLSRDGTSPNQMGADLDMNSNDVLNAGSVNATRVLIGGQNIVPTGTVAIPNASDVPYTPAGTGAVTTNVQSKLRKIVHASDFGCLGDGSNCKTEVEAMFAAVDAGTTIIFEPGTYEFNNIFVPKQLTLMCYGASFILPASIATSSQIFFLRCLATATDGTQIYGGVWDGNASNQLVTEYYIGMIVFTNSSAVKGYVVEDAVFQNHVGMAIHAVGTSNVKIRKNRITCGASGAIIVEASGTGVIVGAEIIGNTIDRSTIDVSTTFQPGITISTIPGTNFAIDWIISNNIIRNVSNTTTQDDAVGIGCRATKGIISDNNIKQGAMGISIDNGEDVTCVGNTISAFWYTGIELAASQSGVLSCTVTGNSIDGASAGSAFGQTGIGITGTGVPLDDIVISGNTVRNCTNFSITVQARSGSTADDMVIANNSLYGKGITLEGADNVTISNNRFKTTSGNAVSLINSIDGATITGNTFTGHTHTPIVTFTGTSMTVTNVLISGNRKDDAGQGWFTTVGGSVTYGANIKAVGNSNSIDTLDLQNDVRGGWLSIGGAPVATYGNGSTLVDISGGSGTTLYVREAGAWVAK